MRFHTLLTSLLGLPCSPCLDPPGGQHPEQAAQAAALHFSVSSRKPFQVKGAMKLSCAM